MVETKDVVIAIFAATTASSALVLVFMGVIAQILWSTDGPSNTVRGQLRIAGGVSAIAFLAGLVCAGLSTWWLALHQPGNVYTAVVAAFILQLVLLGLAGALVVVQTIFRLYRTLYLTLWVGWPCMSHGCPTKCLASI